MEHQLTRPLGFQDFDPLKHARWEYNKAAPRFPSYGMYMSARDLAKFGQLFLDGGRHGNRQLIPAAWVSESTRSHSQIGSGFEGYGFGGYGYMWWVAKENTPFSGSHAASGVGGRFLVVMPRIRAVLVIHNQDKQGQPVPIMAPGALPRLMTMLVAAAGA